jgi:hypothetical protein
LELGKRKETSQEVKWRGKLGGAEKRAATLGANKGKVEAIIFFKSIGISQGFDQLQSSVITTHKNVLAIVEGRARFDLFITVGSTPKERFGFEKGYRVSVPCEGKRGSTTGKASANDGNSGRGTAFRVGFP